MLYAIKKIMTISFVFLNGFLLLESTFADSHSIKESIPKSDSNTNKPIAKSLASNSKFKTVQSKHSFKTGTDDAGKSGKYDTILIDSLDGKKVYFRKFREKIVDPFVDSTDIALEGVTEKDSILFHYFDTAGTKDFDLFKIHGNSDNLYLLHFDYSPSSPPSGQALLVIAPLKGNLKLLNPGQLSFSGELSGFTPEKTSKLKNGFSVSIWSGNFGIEIPIKILSRDDSFFLALPTIKSVRLLKSTAYNFSVTHPPETSRYQNNEEVTLFLDLNKKREIKIKTSKFEDINIHGVWVQIEPGLKRPDLQELFDACREGKNTLLEVKIKDRKGFISYPDYQKLGYPDAG